MITNRSHTVCLLIQTDMKKVLMVERKNAPGLWALPGGKVETSALPSGHIWLEETPLQAIIREVREETGLTLLGAEIIEHVAMPFDGALCHVFLYTGRRDLSGEALVPFPGEARAMWRNVGDLFTIGVSAFWEFYADALIGVPFR